MTIASTPLLIGLLLALAQAPAIAQESDTQLTPTKARITDESIYRDNSLYQTTQDRIQALNDGGRPVRDYHLSKAQCWLDVSFHEYSRNDRSDFPQEALSESTKLITAMEQGVTPLPNETPAVNNATRLREDLWKRFGAIYGTPGYECAQQAMACGEVELVHAGNEFNQQGWRHAKPYVQMAEDYVNDAEALARNCTPVPQNMELTANLLFDFDRDSMQRVHPDSMRAVTEALARVKDEKLKVTAVRLTGHADRIQGPNRQYNEDLSRRRAMSVRDYLVAQGIPAEVISYEWRGDSEPVQSCEGVPAKSLHECLLPNRRVEVKFEVQRASNPGE
ncbi:OmpA family protein [Lysobacter sp. GCM10012299]|uniref:OmpA family protein n=1 Tax=Lysobacter sp. GCM10012299 TaxID=3317333 RepID=UPI00361BF7BA